MADCCNKDGLSVAVIHAQGESRFAHVELMCDLVAKPCSVPDWVGIVTFCNGPMLKAAVLIMQLDNNKIPYINAARNLRIWQNSFKPQLAVMSIEALPDYITHALVLDAHDVVLNGDFARALPGYRSYGKPVLFGATRSNSPDIELDVVADREQRGEFCYLNAGTCFGPRDDVLEFYRITDEIEWDIEREQPLVRAAFAANQEWVDFDWRCQMFQTMACATVEMQQDGIVRVS